MAKKNPAQGGGFDEEAAKRALEAAQQQIQTIKNLNTAAERYKVIWDGISSSIFKIGGAAWFKTVAKTNAELVKEKEIIDQIRGKMSQVRDEIVKGIPNMTKLQVESSKLLEGLSNPKIDAELSSILSGKQAKGLSMSGSDMESFIKKLRDSKVSMNELTKSKKLYEQLELDQYASFEDFKEKRQAFIDSEKKFNEITKKFTKEELQKNLTGVLNGINEIRDDYHKKLILEAFQQGKINDYIEEHGDIALNNLRLAGLINDESAEAVINHIHLNKQLDEATEEYGKIEKEVFSISEGIKAATANLTRGIIDSIGQFDQLISDAQKNTGVMYKNSSDMTYQMTMLTHETAQFGMTMGDTVEMMSMLSAELRTTNFDVLTDAARDFKAIQGATGMAAEDLGIMAGEMMRAGRSSKDVYKFVDSARKQAQILGVSSKKVLADISKNLFKMRELGFKGGEESLARMALKAEKLGQNIDSIFDMAKRARSIEGAMEMAAELQLAGGSFASINPMDLLSAARKGPAELQKLLSQMGQDIGTFNEKTGKMEFDAIDADRLQMVADATGMTVTDLQNQLQRQALDNKKLEFIPDDFFSGIEGMDEEIAKMGFADMLQMKDGKIEMTPNSELADFAKEQGITDYTKMSKEQIDAFFDYQKKNQATMEEQAKQNQSLKKAWDSLGAAFMNLFTIFEPAIQVLTKVVQTISDLFQKMPDWLSGSFAVLLAGLALFGTFLISGLLGFGKGLLGGLKGIMGGGGLGKIFNSGGAGIGKTSIPDTSKLDPKGGGALSGLAAGIKSFGKISPADMLKFATSMAIIGVAIIGFGAALAAVGGDASLGQFVTAGASLVLLGGSLFLLSKLKVDTKGILQLSIAMAIIGAAIIPFAFAAQMMQEVSWETLAKIAVSILGFMILMAGIGALLNSGGWALLLAGVGGLVAVGVGLAVFGASMLVASLGFEALAKIDWSGFSAMGSALLAVVPGLLGFSVAALAFVNPVTLFGLVMMTATLAGLAMVVGSISDSFSEGANGMDRFAAGLEKIQTATDKLDLAKLESLKDLSENLATASATDAIAGAISGVMNKITGGGDKGGKSTKKELVITLKQPNGREIQRVIIDDTELLS